MQDPTPLSEEFPARMQIISGFHADLHQPNMQPENNLIKNLVYSGSKQNIKLTMVNGQILYENGEFRIGFDPEEIYARSNAIIRRISGSHADN